MCKLQCRKFQISFVMLRGRHQEYLVKLIKDLEEYTLRIKIYSEK